MAKNWFVVRVQSGQEELVHESLQKRVKTADREDIISRVLIPSERISEIRGGEKRIRERKIYPGYIMLEVNTDDGGAIPDDAWFIIRETQGIGDFLGVGGRPSPMSKKDVEKILGESERKEKAPAVQIGFSVGEVVRIKEGPFENFEGSVEDIYPAKGTVRVIVTIFGRPTPVEMEYWHLEKT